MILKKMIKTPERMMKPAEYAEHLLITSILSGEWQPGTALPGERTLSEKIGVTRPTLRETLQRMGREGWFKIRHGKSTIVNDYLSEGGMGLLSTLVKYGEYLPDGFIEHFLKMRCVLLPFLAKMAVEENQPQFQEYLEQAENLGSDPKLFMEYDWELQRLIASLSGNPLYRMILNDFDALYRVMGVGYFDFENARLSSMVFYKKLLDAVCKGDAITASVIVRDVMDEALELWKISQK